MNETREIARYASEARYQMLPAEVIDKAKELILDQLGNQLGNVGKCDQVFSGSGV